RQMAWRSFHHWLRIGHGGAANGEASDSSGFFFCRRWKWLSFQPASYTHTRRSPLSARFSDAHSPPTVSGCNSYVLITESNALFPLHSLRLGRPRADLAQRLLSILLKPCNAVHSGRRTQ